jgi:hypothetical protein
MCVAEIWRKPGLYTGLERSITFGRVNNRGAKHRASYAVWTCQTTLLSLPGGPGELCLIFADHLRKGRMNNAVALWAIVEAWCEHGSDLRLTH